jgi:hypothetical protein
MILDRQFSLSIASVRSRRACGVVLLKPRTLPEDPASFAGVTLSAVDWDKRTVTVDGLQNTSSCVLALLFIQNHR